MKSSKTTAILAALLAGTGALASEVRFDGDVLYLRAEHESLLTVLQDFNYAGVAVHIEPGIDAIVNGEINGDPVDAAMAQLLESFNYVLFWDVLRGPLGPLPRLQAIHIFRPGKQRAVQPLLAHRGVYEIAYNPLHVNEPFVKDELLLGLKPGTRAEQFRSLLAMAGGTLAESIPEMGIYRIRLPQDSDVMAIVQQLKAQGSVAVVEPNYIYSLPPPSRDDAAPSQVASPGTPDGTDPSTSRTTESGGFTPANPKTAALAVFDSGLLPGESLDGSVLGRYDAVDPSRALSDPMGHGTQMAMVASGSVVPWGVPPEAGQLRVPILAVRAFDNEGRATSVGIINAIDYAVQNGARVINMSWGTPSSSTFLRDAIDRARDNGIVVVASAGNEPTRLPVYPAAFDNVIGVSAMTADGSLWQRSNYGNFISASAPGTGAFPIGHKGPPGSYAGTSIASAYVARSFALYFGQNPRASVEAAETSFFNSLTDSGTSGTDPYFGRGSLDNAALARFLGD